MTNREKQLKILETVGDYLAEQLEKNGPVTILFQPLSIRFDVIGSENEGMMKLSFKAKDELNLQLGVYRQGTDRLYSNFLPGKSREDMISCLRSSASHQQWLELTAHLSGRVNDFWD